MDVLQPDVNAFFNRVDRNHPGLFSPDDKAQIVSKLRIIKVREFKEHIDKCVRWLRQNLAGRSYGIITVPASKNKAKSSTWLGAVAARGIGYPPAMIIDPDYTIDSDNLTEYIKYINKTARRLGVHDWIYLDDGAYSGNQLLRIFEDELLFASYHNQVEGRVWVAIAFCAPGGRSTLNNITNRNHTAVYCPGSMDAMENIFPKDLMNRILKVNASQCRPGPRGRTLTMMPHKIGNDRSFGIFYNNTPLVRNTHIAPPYKKSLKRPANDRSTKSKNRRTQISKQRTPTINS
jgi:hypothetical protein